MGWDTFQRVMSTYFARWRFGHPRPDDFFATVNDVSRADYTRFFDQVYRSSNVFDYAVDFARSDPLPSGKGFRTVVQVRRRGEAVWPVDVDIAFQDGSRVRENWKGLDRWKVFTIDKASPVESVVVDPGRRLLLDADYANNSYTTHPRGWEAARRWSQRWMIWMQDALLSMAWVL